MRTPKVSRQLKLAYAVQIWDLRYQGRAQHEIAALFSVNQGRISEILTQKRFAAAKRIAEIQARLRRSK